jgi:hypothetical protein
VVAFVRLEIEQACALGDHGARLVYYKRRYDLEAEVAFRAQNKEPAPRLGVEEVLLAANERQIAPVARVSGVERNPL